MPRFYLSAYSVRVKSSRRNAYRNLGNFDRYGADLFEVFRDYLEKRSTIAPDADQDTGKMLQVTKRKRNRKNRILKGIIEAGDFGFTSRLYDTELGENSYDRNTVEAELLPYYFLFQLRPTAKLGFLILQRTGQLGIKRLLSEDLNQEFSSLYPLMQLEINPLVPEQLVEDYLSRGRITKIRFVRNSIPSDFADFVNSGGNFQETTGSMEYSIKVGRNQRVSLPAPIRQFLDRERSLTNLLELQSFEYDNVKVELELGGSRRTIDLSHLERLRAYYDIGNDVDIGGNGHPLFDSIDRIAMRLLNDISTRNAVG